jgi:hypothetical protein
MWKLIFSNVTKRGTGCNREPQDGEFAIDRHPSECAWFNAEPERYQYVDGVFSEVEGWQEEEAAKAAEREIVKQKDAIAAQRYAIETGGVVEPVSGKTILTDRESQQILDSTIEKIRRGLVPSIRWKCKDGWLTLNVNNINDIEILCLTHVQTAFAWEEAEQVRLGLV